MSDFVICSKNSIFLLLEICVVIKSALTKMPFQYTTSENELVSKYDWKVFRFEISEKSKFILVSKLRKNNI